MGRSGNAVKVGLDARLAGYTYMAFILLYAGVVKINVPTALGFVNILAQQFTPVALACSLKFGASPDT